MRGVISSAAILPLRYSAPKIPFRQFLARHSYAVDTGSKDWVVDHADIAANVECFAVPALALF